MSAVEKEEKNEYTMYFFVNNDLGMGKGKIGGQVGHATQYIMEYIFTQSYEHGNKELFIKYKQWKMAGSKKVCLKATQEQIDVLKGLPSSFPVIDAGRTQIAPNSMTVVGFLMTNNMEKILPEISTFKLI